MNKDDSLLFKIFNFKKTCTNVDGLIGKIALVTKDINNIQSTGEVLINYDYWGAINYDEDKIISKGTKVEILSIKGVKLIVRELNKE